MSLQTAHDAIDELELAQREVAQCSRFDGRVLTLLTNNSVKYANFRFKHVCIQYRMPTQRGMPERFYAKLKGGELYWNRYYNPEEERVCLAAYPDSYNQAYPYWVLRLFDCNQLMPSDVCIHGLVLKTSKWQGCARYARKELKEKIRNLGVEAVDNTNEITQEKFTSTKMK